MHLTLRQLQCFSAVAKHLSFTKAADELHLTQPAVSMQIRQLESREDEDYRRWRDQAHQRRYVAPTTEQILDVEFMIE